MFWAEWTETLHRLSEAGEDAVMVTLMHVRGHAPQKAGVKMLVTKDQTFHTLGGGFMEHHATEKARMLLQGNTDEPVSEMLRLTQKETPAHTVQCCGGEVTLLYEVIRFHRQTVAIYGLGHIGQAVAFHLGRLPIELHLFDSRENHLPALSHTRARVQVHHAPIPEATASDLPVGALLLIMTHDHATDLAVLEMALRRKDFAFIGVIGSKVKRQNFRQHLLREGFEAADLERITSPVGLPGIPSKDPEVIALGVSAQILQVLQNKASDPGTGR
ncbi:xanthine dehydrogenase accessory protein XdhC [Deinococcus cellulosilyticus]|uniref:Xanthine dehydrogenase accessory protein XdhC n=1 Tax=Deinococcus cellulosilyticus (strain DSM 18568 / NBRC 106333 / KACC 11606 / 5516J-15) TaxID=1223518 RepID=A0A511NCL6_DEIC1|nr:xanthine dehydrogenase accessory protein XdhC [Deinococcus cellulosilyticus]GEM50081.1 xanthine dehydrogenase accessory protein XdhC [Deinococcus cellulosilyticus NBRC 106333 = KACC 11606]